MKKSLITLLVLAVVVGGVYAVSRFVGGEKVKSQGTSVSDADYVTHVSKEFSFEYPKGWFVEDRWEIGSTSYLRVSNYDPATLNNTPHPEGNYFKVEMWGSTKEKEISFEKWIENFTNQEDYHPSILTKEEISINDLRGIRQIEGSETYSFPVVYIENGERIYVFVPSYFVQDEDRNIFDRIIQSLQFKDA